MKRVLALTLFGLAALALTACPIYESASCYDASDCRVGEYCGGDGFCHVAPGGSKGNLRDCYAPGDCGANQTCGADFRCHPGDCSYPGTGCVSGYECVESAASGHVCMPADDAGLPDGGDDSGSRDPRRCGSPSDCATSETCGADGICHEGHCGTHPCINGFVCTTTSSGPTCVRGNPAACGADDDCADGACVDGLCTAASFLCSDRSQCPSGKSCVDGLCIGRCTTNANCAQGFACHPELGVCTERFIACEATADCEDPSRVCVQSACVPRCGQGAACATGFVCVDNGCVPKAGMAIECDIDGERDVCAEGRICLRHHCYLSCEAPNEGACDAELVSTVCKALTTASGTHSVCGSPQSLGDQCDVSKGHRCDPGRICVDGYCRQR